MTSNILHSTTPFFLEILEDGEINDSEQVVNTFVPKINRALVKSIKRKSPLQDIYLGVDYCNFLRYQFKKISSVNNHFDYINNLFFKPQIKTPDGRCLDYDNPTVVNLLLRNLSKYQLIDPMKVISPKQDKNNCWFNTAFMVFFLSDLGRRFSKYFRQYCITGNINNVYQQDENLRISLFYLNIYIDSCIQGSAYSLYLNSNFISKRIYQTIPYDKFIKDGNSRGCPIRYYYSLISKLNLSQSDDFNPLYEIIMGKNNLNSFGDIRKSIDFYSIFSPSNPITIKEEESFYIYPQRLRDFPDILLVYIDIKKYPSLQVYDKVKYLKLGEAVYCLDSIVIVHLNKPHVCCLVTINKKYFLYDGASYKKLIPFQWMKHLNSSEDIIFECYISGTKNLGTINMRRSPQQYLIYYRIK